MVFTILISYVQHASFAFSFPVRLNVGLLVTFIYTAKCPIFTIDFCQIDDVRDIVFEEARAAIR